MDQTHFTESQEVLQAPTPQQVVVENTAPDPQIKAKKKRKKIILAVVGSLTFILVLMALVLSRQSVTNQGIAPNLEWENQDQKQVKPFTQRFTELKNQLTDYDPTEVELAPPPVDYELQFLPVRR